MARLLASVAEGGTITCNVGDLGGGDRVTITIVVTPTTKGSIQATAAVTATNVSPPDSDDSATATITVLGD
jgi:hypothetical protein